MLSLFQVLLIPSLIVFTPLVLLFAFVAWNVAIDYRKVDLNVGESLPTLVWLLIRVLIQALFKRQGRPSRQWGKVLDTQDKREAVAAFERLNSTLKVVWISYRICPDSLSDYRILCCRAIPDIVPPRKSVPPCYLETLFMKAVILIASSSNFPVSPFGLIHVRQRIKVFEPLQNALNGPLDLQATLGRVERVEKGIEVDICCRVYLRRSDVCIWEGVSTLLSRKKAVISGQKRSDKPPVRQVIQPGEGCYPRGTQVFAALQSTGMRYAAVTGDYNPHHLHPWTSKWLGYSRPIAHGMWTLQRALHTIKSMCPTEAKDRPMQIDCAFKRPLFLPSRIKVAFWKEPDRNGCLRLLVSNSSLATDLHLDATIQPL